MNGEILNLAVHLILYISAGCFFGESSVKGSDARIYCHRPESHGILSVPSLSRAG